VVNKSNRKRTSFELERWVAMVDLFQGEKNFAK